MLSLQFILDKNFYTNKVKKQALLKIKGIKDKTKKIEKQEIKKNIALIIDKSGSMASTLSNDFYKQRVIPQQAPIFPNPNPPLWPGVLPNQPFLGNNNIQNNVWVQPQDNIDALALTHFIPKSKLDLAKEATINFIENLNEGDICSIISFDNTVSLDAVSVKITNSSKEKLKNIVKAIHTGGSTNLHGGWLEGVKSVAKNLKKENLNRVILLTDGHANVGITDINTFSKDVEKISAQGIQTTTIGFGQDFNEDYLMTIANCGNGNAYYADKKEGSDSNLNDILTYELAGLSNICAKEIEIVIKGNKVKNIVNLNNIEMKNNILKINNISLNQELNILYEFDFVNKNMKDDLIEIEIKYKEDNNEVVFSCKEKVKYINTKEYEEVSINEEVGVQNVLINIASEKEKMKHFIDNRDFVSVNNTLQSTVVGATAFAYDARVAKEIEKLQDKEIKLQSGETNSLRKDLTYESYSTRTGLNIK